MLALRQTLRLLSPALMLFGALAGTPAFAQGKLEARYVVTLAGIPIGKGNWAIEITDTHYNAAASGTTTGLMRVFTEGEGTRGAWSGATTVE